MPIKPRCTSVKELPAELIRPAVLPTAVVKIMPIKDQRSASGRPLTLKEKKAALEKQKRL